MIKVTRRSVLHASLGIAAAGALGRPYIANAEAQTAKVWWTQGYLPSEDAAFRELVAGYEKASGNKIDYSILPDAPLRQKEVSALTSGEVPDVMEMTNYFLTSLSAWKGQLLDVSDVVDTQKPQYLEAALLHAYNYNSATKGRAYYGVPMKASAATFHIWKSLVEKAGHKVSDIPDKWTDFINFFKPMQQKLRDQGMRHTYAWGLEISSQGNDPVRTFAAYLNAHGGQGLVTRDGKLHADDPAIKEAVVKAMTQMIALLKGGYVPHSAINWADADNNNAFHAKQMVADFNGSLSMELALYHDKAKYNDIMTHAIPKGDDGKLLPSQIGIVDAVIPKGAKNVKVAKDFLTYAIQPKVLNAYLKGGLGRWAIPYPTVAKDDPFWLKSTDPHRATYIKQILFTPTVPLYVGYNPAAAQLDNEHVFQVALHGAITGGTKPEDAADKALKRAKEIFAKYPIAEG